MTIKLRFIVLLLAFGLAGVPAEATWFRASSPHFIVYDNDSELNLRRFSDQLERFHSAMGFMIGAVANEPSPSNRVTVYVVKTEEEVRRLMGGTNRFAAGFYRPRAGGSAAFVPRTRASTGPLPDFSMVILLHEYAHHLLISSFSFPMPRWMSEGAAEFFASASFEKDGSVGIGRPAMHRANELFYSRDVSVADLLEPEAYEKRKQKSYDAFYGKSWLLYHYLFFDPGRKGQFARYVALLSQGKSLHDAAVGAFGDIARLQHDVDVYLSKTRMMSLRLPATALTVGKIDIRPLRPGEIAMMPVVVRSKAGVTEKTAPEVLKEALVIAPQFAGDAAVQSALAEAEFDAGNDKEAIAAADAALAIDPNEQNAYVQKGYAMFRQAAKAPDRSAAFRQARAPFIALNRLEHDHPLPLVYFYNSFVLQGLKPPPLAVQGLERAVDLAPFDRDLQMTLATQLLHDKKMREARLHLEPVAYNPHGGSAARMAQAMIAKMVEDPDWDGTDPPKVTELPGDEE